MIIKFDYPVGLSMERCGGVHPLSSQSYIRRKRIGISMRKLTLVYFSAVWCSACRMMSPVVNSEEVKDAMDEVGMSLSKVDADTNKDILQEYDVGSLPTVVILEGNKVVARQVGAMSRTKLIELIGTVK